MKEKRETFSNEQENQDLRVVEIEIERLKDFSEHPFKVKADKEMHYLRESIEKFGIMNPLIVRPMKDGCYEIISGHRRRYVAQQLGYYKLPVLIRSLDNDEAVIAMVDSNIQRETITPSEKAFAYKMRYESMRRITGRKKKGCQIGNGIRRGKRTVELLSEELGESPKQIQRYLKLTELIPELLQRVDDGFIAFSPAVELADLTDKEQRELLSALDYAQCSPSISQSQRIKKMSREGTLTPNTMKDILSEVKKGETQRVIFKNEQLYKYFPRRYTSAMMKREIIDILKIWMER